MARLAVARLEAIDARAIGGVLAAKPRETMKGGDAGLVVAPVTRDAIVLGAFQRAASSLDLERVELPMGRRSTGGAALRVREGQLFVAIDLRTPAVMGGVADVNRALNRHVRPLLRALSTLGDAPATWGGRDFVSIRGAPVAWTGVTTHDAEQGAAKIFDALALEIVVALDAPFGVAPQIDMAHGAIAPRWLGKTPGTLREVLGRDVDAKTVTDRIVEAYALQAENDVTAGEMVDAQPLDAGLTQPPFDALVEEAMGLVGAAIEPKTVVIGGELMASPIALHRLGLRLRREGSCLDADDPRLGRAIDAMLGPSVGALLFGVRSLKSIATVVAAAWKNTQKHERPE